MSALWPTDRPGGTQLSPLELNGTSPLSESESDSEPEPVPEAVPVDFLDEPPEDEYVEYIDGDDDGEDEDQEGQVPFVYDASISPGDPAMPAHLQQGAIEVLGLMPWSSNGTYLVQVTDGEHRAPAIYKPEQGERPLWDFPGGLWRREVAAYELSDLLGYGLVPPTVTRTDDDAPFGRGSLQAFVPARFEEHYFTLRDRREFREVLRTLCAFDLVANSADRKGGHCLVDPDDRIWAIDNGLAFHEEFKVRTVIWDFAGEPLPLVAAEGLVRLLDDGPNDALCALLESDEQSAMMNRTRRLLSGGEFPHDPTGRRYPWPLV